MFEILYFLLKGWNNAVPSKLLKYTKKGRFTSVHYRKNKFGDHFKNHKKSVEICSGKPGEIWSGKRENPENTPATSNVLQ